jgi:tRNA (guanine-N7-)-methyltransferase
MRARKKKHESERISACSALLCTDFEKLASDPQSLFPNKAPLHLEIGCGKGNFAIGKAQSENDINLLAMERVSGVMVTALEKALACADKRERDNLRFIIADAKNLPELLPEHSLDCIYINFCDPWPKKGYFKRRLTYRAFLEIYAKLLAPGGVIKLKTDNEMLFDFSLEEFEAAGFTMLWQTRDLHNSEYNRGNIMTEYEYNFSSQGMPIYAVAVRVK